MPATVIVAGILLCPLGSQEVDAESERDGEVQGAQEAQAEQGRPAETQVRKTQVGGAPDYKADDVTIAQPISLQADGPLRHLLRQLRLGHVPPSDNSVNLLARIVGEGHKHAGRTSPPSEITACKMCIGL